MPTRIKTTIFTTAICLVAVAIFAAMVAVEHAKASTAGCSVERPDLSFPGLVFDYFGSGNSDPCTTSGIWEVPSQVRPGTYRVIPTGTFDMGSWTLCATSACRLGTAEIIDNAFLTKPSVLTIPANAKYIRTVEVRLEAVN